MSHFHSSSALLFFLALAPLLSTLVTAEWVVVSSTCVVNVGSVTVSNLRCPEESGRFPRSLAELRNNLVSDDEDQKFCCGPISARFCCDLEAKRAESPDFDPEDNDNDPNEQRDRYVYNEDDEDDSSFFNVYFFLKFTLGLFVLFTLCYVCSSLLCMLLELTCVAVAAISTRLRGRRGPRDDYSDLESPKTRLIRREESNNDTNGSNNYRSANMRTDLYQWEQPPPSYNNAVAVESRAQRDANNA